MADRDLVHQPANAGSGLETGARPYDPPLLPYEIALIEALGCTEREYRQFVRHAQLQARIRPAEYAYIPDVQNDVVSIVVSLVIGLALSAVSTLLAPKAPALESPAKIKGKKLADQIGPTRFNQTTSFDNVSSLAEYGEPIPIPFGARGVGADGESTGGLTLAPALVWSRAYSYGNYQAFEGIYVAGQHGIQTPQQSGVRLGTFALDALGNREFALFWSSRDGNNFPAALIAGDARNGTSGRQVFTAPGMSGEFERSASMAYNPNAQYQFGTATPIHNGTGFRFNWEIVSAPRTSVVGEDNKDVRFEMRAKRRKIAGADADSLTDESLSSTGMPGVGRQYSRRMGFIAIKRNGSSNFEEFADKTIVNIGVDDIAVFEIYYKGWGDFQAEDFQYQGKRVRSVNLKDLSNSARAWRFRAEDLLTVGTRWIIGSSIWVVEDVADVQTEPRTRHVYLRCRSVVGAPTLGIPGYNTIRNPLGGYDGLIFNERKSCGAGFFNVCRLYTSNIRPVRRDSIAIEFGIRSQVWNRASGLCNFNALPTPQQLFEFDSKDITLNTPRMEKYFDRASCFSVMVRPVPKYGEAKKEWVRIPEIFCVIGRAPIDQYNYLRIKPRIQNYYEYRFIPRTGTDVIRNELDTASVVQLKASDGTVFGKDYSTPYGDFRITTTGVQRAVADIKSNDEMFTDPGESDPYPLASFTKTGPTSVSQSDYSTIPANGNMPINAWFTHYLGRAWSNENEGKTKSFTITMTKGNEPAKTLTLKVTATSVKATLGVDVGQRYVDLTGSRYKWSNPTYEVTGFTATWAVGDTIKDNPSVNNLFFNGIVNIQFKCTAIGTLFVKTNKLQNAERVFEQNSQLADCSHYQELQKSNENGPEHEIVYVNEFTENEEPPTYYGMSTVGLAIKSSGQINSVDQMRLWVPNGIQVQRLIQGDTASSNLFADLVYYLLRNNSQGLGNIVPVELIDIEALTIAARFQEANKIFFDNVVEDSESFRSFLYDNAALQLCNFTIKNGRFGMMPALPYDSNYKISTAPIAIEQIFTAGNIIQDSLQVQYIEASQRSNFRALVSWRVTVENDLPTQASALVDWADIPEGSRATTQQAFDLTDFCTNRAQALLTARFLLSIRRRVTHTVSFKTVPDALGIQPGSYIRVITESTTYSATNNGGITDAGTLVSVGSITDGDYDALIYNPQTSEVTERRITISSGSVVDPELYGCLFTLLSLEIGMGVYQVEQLTLDEDGLINISAVHVPTDSTGASIVAKDVLDETAFRSFE